MPSVKRVPKKNKWGDECRFYQVGNHQYPSVTTILKVINKPALIAWSAKVEREMVIDVSADLYADCPSNPRMSRIGWITSLQQRLTKMKAHTKLLKAAGDIGSQAHEWIEWQIKAQLMHADLGPCPVISGPAQMAVAGWERWKETVDFKPIRCEQFVWSHEHKYAGTMDLLAEINGKLTLLDWKSGKAIYKESWLQNIAYRYALEEMGIISSVNECAGMIVRLPKVATDPDTEAKPVEGYPGDLFQAFMHFRAGWEWLQQDEELTESPETQPVQGTNGPTETIGAAVEAAPLV